VVIWDEVQTCIWPSRCHCHSLSLTPVNPDWLYLPGFYLSGTCSLGQSWTNSRTAVKRLCVCILDKVAILKSIFRIISALQNRFVAIQDIPTRSQLVDQKYSHTHTHTHTHIHTYTHTQPYYGPLGFCPGLPG